MQSGVNKAGAALPDNPLRMSGCCSERVCSPCVERMPSTSRKIVPRLRKDEQFGRQRCGAPPRSDVPCHVRRRPDGVLTAADYHHHRLAVTLNRNLRCDGVVRMIPPTGDMSRRQHGRLAPRHCGKRRCHTGIGYEWQRLTGKRERRTYCLGLDAEASTFPYDIGWYDPHRRQESWVKRRSDRRKLGTFGCAYYRNPPSVQSRLTGNPVTQPRQTIDRYVGKGGRTPLHRWVGDPEGA